MEKIAPLAYQIQDTITKINAKMEEAKKYYTPSIEELIHAGFKFDVQVDPGVWVTFHWTEFSHIGAILKGQHTGSKEWCIAEKWKSNDVRVKYLDRKDIESFEWMFVEKRDSRITGREISLYQLGEDGTIFIEYNTGTHLLLIDFDGKNVFLGTIKNKSQLKQILQWTRILK